MQTSYASPSEKVGEVRQRHLAVSLVNAESSSAIPFGRMAQFASGGAKILSGSADLLAGVVIFEHDYDRNSQIDSTEDGPKAGVVMSLLMQGVVMVQVEASVVFGDRPYVRYASSGGNTRIGGFSNTSGTGLRDIGNMGIFIGSASANGFAPLLLDLASASSSPTANDAVLGAPSFSVAAESSNHIDVTVTVKRVDGSTTVAAEHLVEWWLSDAAKGAPSASIPNSGVSIQTGTEILAYAPDVLGRAETNSSGVLVVRVADTGTPTWYLNVNIAGRVYSSGAITFA